MSSRRSFTATVATGLLLQACGSFNGGAVRDLTAAEVEILEATQARLTANQAAVRGALDDLADSAEFALRQQHRLGSSIAKAQLLEAMQSPWSQPGLSTTQREVAMYSLFALAEAEQDALRARIATRRAEIAELGKSYRQLVTTMSALIALQEQLLVHLEQPAKTRISLVVRQALAESQAFRESLDTSDDPRLERLAASVAEREQDIIAVEARIVAVLEALEQD